MIDGIQKLHENYLIHRDIKPKTTLMRNTIYLSDFIVSLRSHDTESLGYILEMFLEHLFLPKINQKASKNYLCSHLVTRFIQ